MAIRFQCAACSEPIEIDDQWARQVVRCPYCQRTVTAPAESTLPAMEEIPVATGVARRREFTSPADPVGPAGAVPPYPPYPQTNRAAVTAMILVLLSIALMVTSSLLMASHTMEVQEYERFMKEANASGTPTMSAVWKYYDSQGGKMPAWMVQAGMLSCATIATWLGGVVFGIIGLFRPVRRGLAIAALVISGLLTGMLCISALGAVAA